MQPKLSEIYQTVYGKANLVLSDIDNGHKHPGSWNIQGDIVNMNVVMATTRVTHHKRMVGNDIHISMRRKTILVFFQCGLLSMRLVWARYRQSSD